MGKISLVKRKNIKGGKMSKGKKTTNKRVTKARRRLTLMKKLKQKNEAAAKGSKAKPALEEIAAGDVLDMLDKEELAFIHSKDRIKNPATVIRKPANKRKKADDEDELLEEMYEIKTIKRRESEKNLRPLLPIKTSRGLEMQFSEEANDSQEKSYLSQPSASLNSKNANFLDTEEFEGVKTGQAITAEELRLRRKQKLAEYKIKIGSLCASFLEDPENKMKNLDSVLAMLVNPDSTVTLSVPKICAVSLQAVFEDVLPSYPIKHAHTEGVKLKAQTRELQGYEAGLLSRYKTYLQRLEKIVGKYLPSRRMFQHQVSEAERSFGIVALRCLCAMLCSHPYFNLAINIMYFVILFLNHRDAEARTIVSRSIKEVFSIDKRGELSHQIVTRINVLIKSRYGPNKSNIIRRDLLDVLLALRIKEADVVREKKEEMIPTKNMTFEQRRMLSKRQRKKAKEMVQLERELLEVSAEENKARKTQNLTQITNVLFAIYFRILKNDEVNESILSAVLDGLSKFAHVISVDYFDDLLKHLNKIQQRKNFSKLHALQCIRTVLSVLDGHGSVLTLDPSGFHKGLYNHLMTLSYETERKTVHLALDCVNLINRKKMPGPRAAAFLKRVATIALHLEHTEALECVNEVKGLIRMQNTARALLDSEGSIASGVYLPQLDDPDHCMAHTSTLWELSLLSRHYDPRVVEAAQTITTGYSNEGSGLKSIRKRK